MMENIQKALTKYWGYDGFLPLQKRAMECISRGTDSIVVLPTGGGKVTYETNGPSVKAKF